MSEETARYWDAQAPTFDQEPDHGLRDPAVRAAWRALLLARLPPPGARIADLGCGTGSLAGLLAREGYRVDGVDLSPRMVEAARAKAAAAGVEARFTVGDATAPPLPDACADAVLVRHLLWALPDRDAALARWARLLTPGGRLLLVEGHWHTGGGLTAEQTRALVVRHLPLVRVDPLPDPALWGGPIRDERYVVVAHRTAAG